jgi:hypothetical protein
MFSKFALWLVLALVFFGVFRQLDSHGAAPFWSWVVVGVAVAFGLIELWLRSTVEKATKRAVKEALEESTNSE